MNRRRRGLLYGNTNMGTLNRQDVGEWFEAEAGPLVLYARQWLDPALAEDVVQECFMRLLQQPIEPEHVKPWLYRVVRNLAWKRHRSQGRRERREEEASRAGPDWFAPDPGARLDAREAEGILRALPDDQREIVTLRIWGGLTFEQMAAVLDSSPATMLRKHREALKRIRNQLETPCVTNTH